MPTENLWRPPATDLLLHCARNQLEPWRIDRIKELCAIELNWQAIVGLAHRHGMEPLLARHLIRHCVSAVPADVVEHLRERERTIAQTSLRLTSVLLRSLSLLNEAGIAALAFKGPVSAMFAYGDVAMRDFGDIDILLRAADVPRAVQLLERHGFIQTPPLSPRRTRIIVEGCFDDQILFSSPAPLELHWMLQPHVLKFDLHIDICLARSQTIDILGHRVATLSDGDSILASVVHGVKHGWERIEWLCSCTEKLRENSETQWEELAHAARRYGCYRMLLLSTLCMNQLLDMPVPPSMLRQISRDKQVCACAHAINDPIVSGTFKPRTLWSKISLDLRSRDRHWQRVDYIVKFLLLPTRRDYSFLPLPLSFWLLYLFVRPLRIILSRTLKMVRASTEVAKCN